ncbi:M24 family metallopeptidase [Mycobacterium sp. Marseille-P9652]|uniref:M24 family metallopeptidase n=1 Tax=Mycobacterium sp. Marseille-P9652 TaxID=2654950 RepID=UPI0012E78948|nr:M24 family metallopeptidase [Mycobacterium sp. Marseille-P9652]
MATEVTPDPRPLRTGRRARALAQMEAHDLDVLVLGRQANVRYVTGAPQLWIAGTRPFGPVCVVVRATGDIYLNSTDDEGVPDEIGRERLYGLAWNPMTLIDVLKKIDGAETARRVGTDAITPTFAALLPEAFPHAEIVDAEPAMRAARRIKTPDEIDAMGLAVSVAERGIAAAAAELRPGVSERALAAAMMGAMAAGGVSTPATQDAAWVTSRQHPWRRAGGTGDVASGDLVVLAAGALANGYVAEVGRTRPAGDAADGHGLFARSDALWDRLITACRPGASSAGLLAAYESAGEPLPPMPVAHGLGLGFDPPVVSESLSAADEDNRLEPGMVLAVTAYVWEGGVGAVFRRDTVHITDGGAEVLTTGP